MVKTTRTDLDEIMELDERYHFGTYGRQPLLLVDGDGCRVRDATGWEYIDMLAGIAVNSLGHCHPEVVKAIRHQAGRLIHCTNLYYNEPQARLAELLVESSDLDRVFFCNSGTEAVEGAIKLARKWASTHGRGGMIITMEGSFHGRSLAAITATGQDKYRLGFDPLPAGFRLVPFNDLEAVERTVEELGTEVCAIMVEPVQGEGGIRIADQDYLAGLRRLCYEKELLLIFDEVQCGMGRTGFLFAYQGYNVVPDVLTLAKALGGGFPIGALLASEEVARSFGKGDHGTTFGGNPLATAAAFATLSVMLRDELPRRSRELGVYLKTKLMERIRDLDVVSEVRGRGLMVGVVLDQNGKEVVDRMRAKSVLLDCTADTVIRWVPPLNVPKRDLDLAIEAFIECLKEVSG
jgi:predicted acetylornithine/succinylornithine family transaminase